MQRHSVYRLDNNSSEDWKVYIIFPADVTSGESSKFSRNCSFIVFPHAEEEEAGSFLVFSENGNEMKSNVETLFQHMMLLRRGYRNRL